MDGSRRHSSTMAVLRAALSATALGSSALSLLSAIIIGSTPKGIPGHDPNGMLLLVLVGLVQAAMGLVLMPHRNR